MSHSNEQAAAAAQLARALREYDRLLGTLLQGPWDAELYRELSDQFDRMQLQVQLLPRLTLAWTELLISRAELLHALWSRAVPARVDGRVAAYHAHHRALVEAMLRACAPYMGARQTAAGGMMRG